MKCVMLEQGYEQGSCLVKMLDGNKKRSCEATLKKEGDNWFRLIQAAHLSRPEHYFSIYQSGCNHSCKKCHSFEFTKSFKGKWYSLGEIARMAKRYEKNVTVWEPRERATMWHATDLCHSCGFCVTRGYRGDLCPGVLAPEQILLSPQGFGPARNIVAFTGGDIVCRAEFYAEVATQIKKECSRIWVLIETNGYGLTPRNLDLLAGGGVDSFWLDIKAYEERVYQKLCGTTNSWILKAPEEILKRGFVLEVLALFIPGWVEREEIVKIAQLLYQLDPQIPFTLLAFFPIYQLKDNRPPTLKEMLETYQAAKGVGLKKVKLGNCGVFVKTEEDWAILLSVVGKEGI